MPKVRQHENRTAMGRILRDDVKEELSCTASNRGHSNSFVIFPVRLVFDSTGWNARTVLTTPRNGAK